MTSELRDFQAILFRLEKVERTNRNLKCLLLAMCCLLCLFLALKARVKVEAAENPQVLEAQELRIKDPSGKLRAQIRASEDAVGIVLYAKDGKQKVGIATGAASTGVTFDAPDGKTKIGLVADSHGPALGFYNSDGLVRSYLTSQGLEAQNFTLKDAAGHERGSLFATESSWGLALYNRDSSKAAAFFVSDVGNAALLSDHKGNSCFTAYVNDKESNFGMPDVNTHQTKFELKNNAQGSALVFRDDNGTDRVGMGFSPAGGAITINDANSTTRAVIEENIGLTTFDPKGSFLWGVGFDKFSKEEQEVMRKVMENSFQNRRK